MKYFSRHFLFSLDTLGVTPSDINALNGTWAAVKPEDDIVAMRISNDGTYLSVTVLLSSNEDDKCCEIGNAFDQSAIMPRLSYVLYSEKLLYLSH